MGRIRSEDEFFSGPHEPILVVRGAVPGTELKLRDELRALAGTGLRVNVKPYTSSGDAVRKDLLRASVVLMPSRAEGFGLVALEAIEAGVPILVSSRSGIADLLRERADASTDDKFVLNFIVDVQDEPFASWCS